MFRFNTNRIIMINKVSNITFTGYRQNFTDEEFQREITKSTQWAKDNIDNRRYLLPRTLMDMQLEREAKNAPKTLSKLREIFSAHDMEPMLELSIKENELVGNISFSKFFFYCLNEVSEFENGKSLDGFKNLKRLFGCHFYFLQFFIYYKC